MKRKEFEENLVQKAQSDPEFRARLLADPAGVIADELKTINQGMTLPPHVKLSVVEEGPDQLYIVLPPAPAAAGSLSDAELGAIAGGQSGPGSGGQPGTGTFASGVVFSGVFISTYDPTTMVIAVA